MPINFCRSMDFVSPSTCGNLSELRAKKYPREAGEGEKSKQKKQGPQQVGPECHCTGLQSPSAKAS
jgi:hypothetical protein